MPDKVGEMPLVSVVVPAFNAADYIASSVRSVLDQTYRNLEVVVVDDGSTDDTGEVVAALGDDRVRVVRQENGGEAAARNTGLDAARGELVAWQDADDVSLPLRIELQVAALVSAGAGFAHTDMLLVDESDRPLGLWQAVGLPRRWVLPFLLRVGTPYNNPTMLVRAEVLRDRRFDTRLRVGTDTDMVRQFAPGIAGVHVPEPLVLYRRHAASATASGGPEIGWPQLEKLLAAHPLRDLVPDAYLGLEESDADAVATAWAAILVLWRGHVEPATALLERALTMRVGSSVTPLLSALVAMAQGEQDKARELAAAGPASALADCLRARGFSDIGDPATALALYRRVAEMYRGSFEAYVGLRGLGTAAGLNLLDAGLW